MSFMFHQLMLQKMCTKDRFSFLWVIFNGIEQNVLEVFFYDLAFCFPFLQNEKKNRKVVANLKSHHNFLVLLFYEDREYYVAIFKHFSLLSNTSLIPSIKIYQFVGKELLVIFHFGGAGDKIAKWYHRRQTKYCQISLLLSLFSNEFAYFWQFCQDLKSKFNRKFFLLLV